MTHESEVALMKRNIAIVLAGIILLIVIVIGVSCRKEAPTWQEQYDLGIRYLSEGNYQEAIIAFTAAIEIDAKRPEAYLKAAEAYEATGDSEAARAILEKGYAATGDGSLLSNGIVSGENITTLSLDVPNLKEKYWVDKSESRDHICEYSWGVDFTDGINEYRVATSYFKHPDKAPREITLYQMQSDVWLINDSDGTNICEAELQVEEDMLLWTFSIPNEYEFDAGNLKVTGSEVILNGNPLLNSNEYTAKELWVMTSDNIFSPEGTLVYIDNFEYNEHGFISGEETYHANQEGEFELIDKRSWEYQYYGEYADGICTITGGFSEELVEEGIMERSAEQKHCLRGIYGGYGVSDPSSGTNVAFFPSLSEEERFEIETNGRWTYEDGTYSTYVFDENGNPVLVTSYSPNGELTGSVELEWKLIHPIM